MEIRRLLGLSQFICRLRGADCGGLDVLNVKMMQIGLSDVCG